MISARSNVLHEDDTLEISHRPGSGRNAVISFAGVGLHYGGVQVPEFSKSLESAKGDIYFVKDKLRHWYLETADRIADVLNRNLQARNIENTTCIGNSMGGFGAIYFAPRLLNCRTAVAFSPQSSINTRLVPWEQRWKEWRTSVPPGEGLDVAQSLDPVVSYTVFVGLRNARDIGHAQRLTKKAPASATVIVLRECGHGTAAHLKEKGVLAPLLLALLAGRKGEAMDLLQGIPHEILTSKNAGEILKAARNMRE